MKDNQEEPITPGCPSLMPHNLPGGFDGVEPGEDNDNDKCICAIVETKGEINKFRKWDTRVLYATLLFALAASSIAIAKKISKE